MSKVILPGTVTNPLPKRSALIPELRHESVALTSPTRLVPMALDPGGLNMNQSGVTTAGGVLVAIGQGVNVEAKFLGNNNGQVKFGENTKKNHQLIEHAHGIMCQHLGISPSLRISVDSTAVMKHGGYGSSGATLASICAAINELYGRPIKDEDLLRYIVTNYAEQSGDHLEQNTCVGTSVGGVFMPEGVNGGVRVLKAGRILGSAPYQGDAIIGQPHDFVPMPTQEMIHWEEENYKSLGNDGGKFAAEIDTSLRSKGLPRMAQGDISGIGEMVADYVSDDRAHPNCYPGARDIYREMRGPLFDKGNCDMLGISSVSPTFFALTDSKTKEEAVREEFDSRKFKTVKFPVTNSGYKVTSRDDKPVGGRDGTE